MTREDSQQGKPTIGLLFKERGNFVLQKKFTDKGSVVNKTLDEVEHHERFLLEAGYRVRRLTWGPDILNELQARDFDLVFNVSSLSEAALLEEMGIPYVGSDPYTISLATEKSLAKRLWLQEGLPTAPFEVLKTMVDCEHFLAKKSLTYPLFLKPVAGRGSAGISPTSVVHNDADLRAGVSERLHSIGQAVLCETYLRGREITIGVLGTENPVALPPLEIVLKEGDLALTFDKKEKDDDTFLCPAPLSAEQTRSLQDLAVRAYQILGFRDYGRIDLILTAQGPYLLEGNTFAGLMCTPVERPHSYIGFMARAAAMDAGTLLNTIVQSAWSRTKV